MYPTRSPFLQQEKRWYSAVMDMEQLSKSQIILLTLLVSFVTSIATGIVTVSLMEQAPPAIAQTVNRVIERTVEKVVPGQTAAAASTVITREKTVVLKESDLVADAVKRVSPSIVRLYSSDVESPTFLGLGLVLDAGGRVVTDTAALGDYADARVAMPDGSRVRAFVKSRDVLNGLAFLQAATTTESGGQQKAIPWVGAALSSERPVLGSSVIVLSGKTIFRIGSGIVTAIIPQNDNEDVVDTNVPQDSLMRGSPLINSDGSVLGVSTEVSRASSPTGFLAATVLLPAPAASTKEKK